MTEMEQQETEPGGQDTQEFEVPGEGADRQGDPEPGESGSDQSERADK